MRVVEMMGDSVELGHPNGNGVALASGALVESWVVDW
jgi:hypothetical protein